MSSPAAQPGSGSPHPPSGTSQGGRRVRVLLADDQEMVRDGLVTILEADGTIEVAAAVPDGAQAVARAAEGGIDVVVMDVRMPVMDGIEATRQILAGGQGSPHVLILTTYGLDEYVYEAIGWGARGFLLKDAPAAELIRAVHIVADGGALLSPEVTPAVVEDVAARRRWRMPANPGAVASLTPREIDVLQCLAQGMSNAEIAADLVLTEHTVKTHLGRILDKLQLRDRTQAVIFAYENGLVSGQS